MGFISTASRIVALYTYLPTYLCNRHDVVAIELPISATGLMVLLSLQQGWCFCCWAASLITQWFPYGVWTVSNLGFSIWIMIAWLAIRFFLMWTLKLFHIVTFFLFFCFLTGTCNTCFEFDINMSLKVGLTVYGGLTPKDQFSLFCRMI